MSETKNETSHRARGIGQIGPWKEGETLLLTFQYRGEVVLKVAAIGSNPDAGTYRQDYEYWHATNAPGPSARGDVMDLDVVSSRCTGAEIDAFFADTMEALEWPQEFTAWAAGPFTLQPGETSYLFNLRAIEPGAENVGLLLVRPSQAANRPTLSGVAWYRVTRLPYAWAPPRLGHFELDLVSLDNDPSALGPGRWSYLLQHPPGH